MSERHNFEMWQQISHVTAILSERDDRIEEYRCRYIYEEHKNDPLFIHYQKYILQLFDNYSQEQVLAERDLQQYASKVNTKAFCLMQVYKLVCFMEIFVGVHIEKMLVVFVRFDMHRYYIMDIRNIHWRIADPSQFNRVFMEKIIIRDPEYTRQHLGKVMSDAYLEDDEIRNDVNQKQAKLDSIYEEHKRNINLDLYKKEPVDTRADEAFAEFHPELAAMNIKLSDLIEGNVEMKGVEKYFHNLYGTHSHIKKGKLPPYGQGSYPHVSSWNRDGKSRFRINSASATKLIQRGSKGDTYYSPFSEEILWRKKMMLKTCGSNRNLLCMEEKSHTKDKNTKLVDSLYSLSMQSVK